MDFKSTEFVNRMKNLINCDQVRVSKCPDKMFLIVGFNRNTSQDKEAWYDQNGVRKDWDYVDEKVVASGATVDELIASAERYVRLSSMTVADFLRQPSNDGLRALDRNNTSNYVKTITYHQIDSPNELNQGITVEALGSPGPGGAHHFYSISPHSTELKRAINVAYLRFQNGPVKEVGVNGISMEALLAVLIDRVTDFQAGPYVCQDNAELLSHLSAALECCHKRTRDRVKRGVEGINAK